MSWPTTMPGIPPDKITVLALKTTCRDRWRQVLEEAPDVPKRHILTLQPGISVSQLRQMKAANVSLVVPEELQKDYNVKESGIEAADGLETLHQTGAASGDRLIHSLSEGSDCSRGCAKAK